VNACHTSAAGIKELLNPFPSSHSRAEFPPPISLTSSSVTLSRESTIEGESAKEKEAVVRTAENNDTISMKEVEVTSVKDQDSAADTMPEIDFMQQYRNGHIPFEFEKNETVKGEGEGDGEGESEVESEINSNIAAYTDTDTDGNMGREGVEKGRGYVAGVRERPIGPLTADSFYLDMFKTMCDSVNIGMVISDMSVPGCPLVHLNKAFSDLTGYDKDKIGTNCKFLQTECTQRYLAAEVESALKHNQALVIKLNQQKADGTVFPCLLALHPVVNVAVKTGFHFDASNNDGAYVRVTETMTEKHSSHGHDLEYKYQIWLFIDSSKPQHIHSAEIIEMARILRLLPQSVFNQMLPGATAAVAQLEDLCNIKSFSRSFLTEFAENIDVTRNFDSSNGHHLSTIRGEAPTKHSRSTSAASSLSSPSLPTSIIFSLPLYRTLYLPSHISLLLPLLFFPSPYPLSLMGHFAKKLHILMVSCIALASWNEA
jgi:hypothetical protein